MYRQETIFARAGVEIASSTLADWVGRCGVAMQPLVEAIRAALHQQPVLSVLVWGITKQNFAGHTYPGTWEGDKIRVVFYIPKQY